MNTIYNSGFFLRRNLLMATCNQALWLILVGVWPGCSTLEKFWINLLGVKVHPHIAYPYLLVAIIDWVWIEATCAQILILLVPIIWVRPIITQRHLRVPTNDVAILLLLGHGHHLAIVIWFLTRVSHLLPISLFFLMLNCWNWRENLSQVDNLGLLGWSSSEVVGRGAVLRLDVILHERLHLLRRSSEVSAVSCPINWLFFLWAFWFRYIISWILLRLLLHLVLWWLDKLLLFLVGHVPLGRNSRCIGWHVILCP